MLHRPTGWDVPGADVAPGIVNGESNDSHSLIFVRASGLRKYVVWTTPADAGISRRDTDSIGNDAHPFTVNTPSVGTTRSFFASLKILSMSLSFTSVLS